LSFKENLKFMHTNTPLPLTQWIYLRLKQNKIIIKLGGKFRLPFLPQLGGGGGGVWSFIHNRFGLKAGKKS
jgi:hypothetical protein